MKEEKKFNLSFYKVDEECILPFIEINFKGKDSKIYSAIMLMDTGSNINAITTEMRVFIDDADWLPEESDEVVSLDNKDIVHSCANFHFLMGGYIFQEKFLIFDDMHVMQFGDRKFVGILGTRFMQQYHLVIDYELMSVRQSDLTMEALQKKRCDFIIPMEYGLKYYNCPILKIRGEKSDAIVLVDTGCDNFSISQNAIEECRLSYKIIADVQSLIGGNGIVDAKMCELDFRLADHLGNDIDTDSFKEEVYVLPHSYNFTEDGECDDDGNLLSTIEGMVGSPFMAKQKWVLDFCVKVIYKLK